jgi:hypothetical protein
VTKKDPIAFDGPGVDFVATSLEVPGPPRGLTDDPFVMQVIERMEREPSFRKEVEDAYAKRLFGEPAKRDVIGPLPWHVRHWVTDGFWRIEAADGQLVATVLSRGRDGITPDDEGREVAVAICTAVNRAGPRVCANCGKPASCFGSYETELHPAYACNACCAHGNEDGHCEPLGDDG